MKILTFCLALVVMSCTLASGQTYKVLWTFGGSPNDGANSISSLVSDRSGNLYGTTEFGGAHILGGAGAGTIFKLSPQFDGSVTEKVLYNFCANVVNGRCIDGVFPRSALVSDAHGNLYGTTYNGGSADCPSNSSGCGVVFELAPPTQGSTWTETVLYNFCSNLVNNRCLDGGLPVGQLTFDQSGNLYGTTTGGGSANGHGAVFELSPGLGTWTETVLYSFCGNVQGNICPDGNQPMAGITFDESGNIFGTTELGGAKNSRGSGTVYKLSSNAGTWMENVLVNFIEKDNLQIPLGSVTFDPAGNLYTTASAGPGGVLELRAKTHTQRSFLFNTNNGSGPTAGVRVDPKTGYIYGTTVNGGSGRGGVVYKIAASGQETVLYNFCQQTDCTDGLNPYAGLIEDKAGNFYGTAKSGGTNNNGVVFEITP